MIPQPQSERTYTFTEVIDAFALRDEYRTLISRAEALRLQLNEETYGTLLAPTPVPQSTLAEYTDYCEKLREFEPLFKKEINALEPIVQEITRLTCAKDTKIEVD